MISNTPKLIEGGNFKDERGQIDFVNDFNLSEVKRMYFTTHFSTDVIRAWQGHKIESRWFFCTKGSFKVKLVKIDNWENPSDNLEVLEYELNENKPKVLYIPKGFVNGFKALENDSKLMIMANYAINEIENDQVRFNSDKWTTWKKK